MSTSSSPLRHVPILAESFGGTPSVFDLLKPQLEETVLDATLGLGGHAQAFLERIGEHGTLIGLDADKQNLEVARARLVKLPGMITLHHVNFRDIGSLNLPPLDILFADIGLSSPHLDDAARGFSFRENAPLDMRFDRTSGKTAAEFLRGSSFDDLRKIFREYAELREAGYIARAVHESAQAGTMNTTDDLKKAVEKASGWRAKDAMAQVFQAVRIAVNDELGALEKLLLQGPQLLKPGGRMGIISFHSLEDRMVKQRFRELTTAVVDDVTGQDKEPAPFSLLTKRAVTPSQQELDTNPRSRSAKFRAIERRSEKIQDTTHNRP